jgi:hypothetical protein
MADRGAGKAKKRPAKPRKRAGGPPALRPADVDSPTETNADPQQRVQALEAECRRLKVELDSALSRISALEQSRDLVRNRIDWVIDSLHNMLNE